LPIASQLNTLLKQMIEMDMSKRPASMTIVKKELQNLLAQQTPRSQSKTQAPVKRRRFLVGLVSTVATCAITTYLIQNPNLLDLLFAHPFSGTTPVLSPAHLVPEQAMILNRSLYTYSKHIGTVTAVAWSPDGQHIASSGTLDSSVQVWDAYTGKLVFLSHSHEKDLAIFAPNPQRVDALAWSPDSTQIAAALGNDTVGVWSIETVDEKFFPFTTTGISNALAWSPDGSRIAAVTGNIFVQVCSAMTGKLSDTYPGNTQAVLTLAWSPDGKHIASGGADGTV
jgi:WD40 repeat protein